MEKQWWDRRKTYMDTPKRGKALVSQPLTDSKSSKGAPELAAQALLSTCHDTCCLLLSF